MAFTTWLDLKQAAAQARGVAEALSRLRPEREADFMGNYAALEADLLQLDKQIEVIVSTGPDQPLVASHPVYQYFQRRYGVNLVSVMWEPGNVPSEALWSEYQLRLGDHPARWMIWEGEPVLDSVERLSTMGVESLVFDPQGNRPDEGDFLSVMQQNAKNLQRAFDAEPGKDSRLAPMSRMVRNSRGRTGSAMH